MFDSSKKKYSLLLIFDIIQCFSLPLSLFLLPFHKIFLNLDHFSLMVIIIGWQCMHAVNLKYFSFTIYEILIDLNEKIYNNIKVQYMFNIIGAKTIFRTKTIVTLFTNSSDSAINKSLYYIITIFLSQLVFGCFIIGNITNNTI